MCRRSCLVALNVVISYFDSSDTTLSSFELQRRAVPFGKQQQQHLFVIGV